MLKRRRKRRLDSRINRKGRPPKLPDLEELLAKILSEQTDRKTTLEMILISIKDKALEGGLEGRG